MQQVKKWFGKTAFAGALGIVVGLGVDFPAIISVGVALIFLHPFLNGQGRETFRRLKHHLPALLLIALYILEIINGLYTENKDEWGENLRIKLPLLLLPFGMLAPGTFSKKDVRLLLYIFILGIGLSSLYTIAWLFTTEGGAAQLQLLREGKPIDKIPTGVNHIYFSFMLAFTVLAGLWLWRQREFKGVWQALLVFIIIVAIGYLHTLSARTGLLALYGSGLTLGAAWLFRKRKKWQVALFAILAAGAIVLVLQLPGPIQRKIEYTRRDIGTFMRGEDINHHSISSRIAAYDVAWHLWLRNPVFGVGMGDVVEDMKPVYAERYPVLWDYKQPHNQWLNYLAGTGIVGFLLLLMIWLSPFIRRETALSWPFLTVWLVMFFTLLVEDALDRQIGVSFFVFFWFIFLNYSETSTQPEPQNLHLSSS